MYDVYKVSSKVQAPRFPIPRTFLLFFFFTSGSLDLQTFKGSRHQETFVSYMRTFTAGSKSCLSTSYYTLSFYAASRPSTAIARQTSPLKRATQRHSAALLLHHGCHPPIFAALQTFRHLALLHSFHVSIRQSI